MIDGHVQQQLVIDPTNSTYQNSRYMTNVGLTVVTIAYGAYGIAKGLWCAGRALIYGAAEAAVPIKTAARASAKPRAPVAVGETKPLPKGHMWQEASPFKDKTAQELHEMFIKKGFEPKGDDPMNGIGSYLNDKNQRKYHIDPKGTGRYNEPNHVDVEHLDAFKETLKKKRFEYRDD